MKPEAVEFPERVAERLQKLPGVSSAAASVCDLPLVRTIEDWFEIQGGPAPRPAERDATRFPITSGYFHTLGIRLLYEREFGDRDGPNAPRVVIVNRALARMISPAEWNAIGQRIVSGDLGGPPHEYEIVGIVDDIRLWPRQDYHPQMYFPQA